MSKKINIGKLLLLLLIPVALIALYFLATKNSDNEVCKDVSITINHKSEESLLSELDIYKILGYPAGKSQLIGKKAGELKMNEMEKKLIKNLTIQKQRVKNEISTEIKRKIHKRDSAYFM